MKLDKEITKREAEASETAKNIEKLEAKRLEEVARLE